jgi:hypothetical protein
MGLTVTVVAGRQQFDMYIVEADGGAPSVTVSNVGVATWQPVAAPLPPAPSFPNDGIGGPGGPGPIDAAAEGEVVGVRAIGLSRIVPIPIWRATDRQPLGTATSSAPCRLG